MVGNQSFRVARFSNIVRELRMRESPMTRSRGYLLPLPAFGHRRVEQPSPRVSIGQAGSRSGASAEGETTGDAMASAEANAEAGGATAKAERHRAPALRAPMTGTLSRRETRRSGEDACLIEICPSRTWDRPSVGQHRPRSYPMSHAVSNHLGPLAFSRPTTSSLMARARHRGPERTTTVASITPGATD